jgi:chromosome segregation ATPase
MIKKAILVTAGVCLVGLVFFGRDALSYFRTSAGWVKESVRGSVPMDFEIDRARRMVKELVPDIRKNMHVIAKEEVEVENLKKQIAHTVARLDKDKGELVRLKTDLGTGNNVFQYAGRSYSANQVKVDLANRFERYKTNDATLASLREIQNARERSLAAAREKLEGMLAAKRKLEVDVEHLEARMKMVEAAQTTSDCTFDDSRLSRVKELITDLRTRLDVAERLTTAEGAFHDEIPLSDDATAPANIVDEVTEYLHLDPAHQVAEVAAGPAAK